MESINHHEMSGKIPKPLRLLENCGSASNSIGSGPNSPLTPLGHRFHCDSPSPFIQSIPESNILSDCVVFCDVWSRNGTDNASSLYNRILDRMGAIVTKKFTKFDPITHFVFKSGHKSYVEKAQKRGIKIVSCVWVERCRITQTKVDEADFLVDVSNYKPPKKFREMQPLYPEEEKERWEKKEKRRMKREERLEAKRVQFISPLVLPDSNGFTRQNQVLAPDTPFIYNSPFQFVRPNFISETPDDYIQKKIQRMKEGKPIFSPPSSPCSSVSSLASQIKLTDEKGKTSLNPETIMNISKDSPTRCLSFSDNEGLISPDRKSTKEILNSQKSDMELTCVNLKGSQKSDMDLTCMNLKGHCMAKSNLSGPSRHDDSSSIKLQLSRCSSTTTNISSSSSHLLLHEESRMQELSSSLHLRLDGSDAPDSTCSSPHLDGNRKLNSHSPQMLKEEDKRNSACSHSHNDGDRMEGSGSSLCLRMEESDASDLTHLDENRDQESNSSLHLRLKESIAPDSTSSELCLRLDASGGRKDSLEVVVSSQEQSIALQARADERKKISNGKMKAKRRFLCDEDILKPASILISPQHLLTPRRSSRRSSIIAANSISAATSGRRRKSVIRRIDMETPSESDSNSILPPVGVSTVKAFAARERYFAPPVEEVSSSDEDNTRKTGSRKSMSTSYDEKENRVDGKKKNISRSVRKRSRASTTSSSSSGERKSRTQPSSNAHRSSVTDQSSKTQPSSKRRTQQPLTNVTNGTRPRRSTDEFKTAMLPKKRRRKDVIVLTSLHREERMQIEKIVKKLGRFCVHQSVSDDRASHVICGAARRTVNVLRAISRGLWLLSKQWVFNSEQAGHWLDEVDYEAVHYFPVARETRLQRHCAPNTALPWSSTLFSPLEGRIFVSSDTQPPADDLRELVTLCGGHVTNSPRRAVVRVGPLSTSQCLTSVKETWVLDSISENCLKPTDAYLIT